MDRQSDYPVMDGIFYGCIYAEYSGLQGINRLEKMPSITISRIIGTANRKTARLILPLVKSVSVPLIASIKALISFCMLKMGKLVVY